MRTVLTLGAAICSVLVPGHIIAGFAPPSSNADSMMTSTPSSMSSSSHVDELTYSDTARQGRSKQVYRDGLRQVAGCVAITSENKIVLVTSNARPDEWILPKGGQENDEEADKSALRETWEEAGVRGEITRSLGRISHPKQKCEFIWFEMDVHHVLEQFPEMNKRKRCMVDIDTAMKLVRKEWMIEALKRCRLYNSSTDDTSNS